MPRWNGTMTRENRWSPRARDPDGEQGFVQGSVEKRHGFVQAIGNRAEEAWTTCNKPGGVLLKCDEFAGKDPTTCSALTAAILFTSRSTRKKLDITLPAKSPPPITTAS
jgi:hypothetical protein